MKKILIGLVALSAVSMAVTSNPMYIVPKIGLDLATEYKNAPDTDSYLAGSIGVEGYMQMNEMFDLGFGLAFEKHPTVKTWDWNNDSDEMYNSIPFYGIAKFNIPAQGEVKPFLAMNLGYSINTDSDVDNGLYFGIGGGLEYQNFIFDLMYKNNGAEFGPWDVDYSRFELGFGYRFDM